MQLKYILFKQFKQFKKLLLLSTYFLILSTLLSCGDNQTGPTDVKWDRDACDRCQMMLSDRKFSAQIRFFPEGKRSKVKKFDDIGCASLWLSHDDNQQWLKDNKTQIWVTDLNSGEWIDAKKAWYLKEQISPMNYGLGAVKENQSGTITFDDARKHIQQIEDKLNIHGGNFNHK